MHPLRKQRIYAIVTVLLGAIAALVLVMSALSKNMNLFYSPSELVSSNVAPGSVVRAGGMVASGSIQKSTDSLEVIFLITDFHLSKLLLTMEYFLIFSQRMLVLWLRVF